MTSVIKHYKVASKEEFYGLPTFPNAEGKKYTAIVTGANGITGAHILRVLAEAPDRWGDIYALSRKLPVSRVDGSINYLAIDFLASPEDIAKQLKEQVPKVDYVFFASYVQAPPKEGLGLWSDAVEMERLNRFIIGAVREASMNIANGLALYAAIQKELGRALEFPGDTLAYHAEWTALTPSARNQILNISDGSTFSYGKFWPVLAAIHGIPYGTPELNNAKFQALEMPTSPPPRGFGPAGKVRVAWTFEAWANKSEVRAAWESLKVRHNLAPQPDPFDKIQDIFGLLDGEILGPWGRSLR
ncbi:aldo-keto reductase family [Trichoderma arundinaceum]|uniref:Aldo-keto reductase family n=1 Tax=Trichoderma arundinaceum TaxID=490622 RepID=A0A395NY95_TRIAR|nr:aldo-keto reductase family [Trichoderma arundinaceum]